MANAHIVVMPPEEKEHSNRFGKGQPANDLGQAGKLKARMLKYARGKSLKGLRILASIMEDENNTAVVRKDAAIAMLNRAWGAPRQEIEIADAGATLEEMLMAIWGQHADNAKVIEPSADSMGAEVYINERDTEE